MNDVLRHIASDNPRVMVVDGSKVARTLITRVLEKGLAGVTVIACETGAEAQDALHAGVVDLVTTARHGRRGAGEIRARARATGLHSDRRSFR